ncbi:MAG: AAA family ATPase [Flavobacteriales bacterium]|nr:AAA family ATPase [Flavobacteriales bacterium]
MNKIRIRNFGPIREGLEENGGWIELKKLTILTGNQGSGKSTVAKLASTLAWIEKRMVKGVMKPDWLNTHNRFVKHCSYHNLSGYFKKDTEIGFEGNAYRFTFKDGRFESRPVSTNAYLLPKIMYVPAERNFLAAVEQAQQAKYLPSPLVTFQDEYRRALKSVKGTLGLPITGAALTVANGVPYIKGEDYEIRLSQASSGFQSTVPMFLVSHDLANTISKGADPSMREFSSAEMKKLRKDIERILLNDSLAEEVKQESLRVLSSKIKIDCFVNVVEEPEQNLYPTSQRGMLNALLNHVNMTDGNRLIITTHSPYVIHYLTLAIKAKQIIAKAGQDSGITDAVNELVPLDSAIDASDCAIYELDDNGTIAALERYQGLPSDENELNNHLAVFNTLFSQLLDLEDRCR